MKETAEYIAPVDNKSVTLSMGGEEGDTITGNGGTYEVDTDDDVNLEDTPDDENDDGVDGEVDADDDADADGEPQADAESELGDFDAEDPAVIEAFDQKYTTEDGSLDAEGALSAEYFANVEKGLDGLNEATYEYLASKGISKATVKQIEAMAATNAEAAKNSVKSHDLELFEVAGGPDELSKALKWGKDGGYNQAQQDRFNKVSKGKDLEAKKEAVEALMSRYKKANPPEKPRVPKRDATKGQAQAKGGVKPYSSRKEMREIRDALRDNDKAGWAAHNRRLSVSTFE